MLENLTLQKDIRTFSVCPENLTGEKGKAAMAIEGSASHAARDLGQGWKVNPYLVLQEKCRTMMFPHHPDVHFDLEADCQCVGFHVAQYQARTNHPVP